MARCLVAATFQAKRELWKKCLIGDDPNSIYHQLSQLTWDMAVWRCINHARGLSKTDADGCACNNAALHELLDRCFASSFLVAIRKVVDSSSTLDGKRGVYSLAAIVRDMQTNAELLTRDAIFEAENLPYDSDPSQSVHESDWFRYRHATNRHKELDKLCDVLPNERSSTDCVRDDVFEDTLKEIVEQVKDIKRRVDKFVAHAASLERRMQVCGNAKGSPIRWRELWDALKFISGRGNWISKSILGSPFPNLLPIPQFDVYKYIDQPLVKQEHIVDLRRLWDEIQEQTETWIREPEN